MDKNDRKLLRSMQPTVGYVVECFLENRPEDLKSGFDVREALCTMISDGRLGQDIKDAWFTSPVWRKAIETKCIRHLGFDPKEVLR